MYGVIHKIKGAMVSFESLTGYQCKGIFYHRQENKITVIHVHGSYGNFYDNAFIHKMAYEYDKAGVNLLSFNLQTYGGFNDGFIHNSYCYIGGALSPFETCCADIGGAIKFVSQFKQQIILQGHSLGTDKILYYMINSGETYPFILLSPCDSYALQENWIYPEKVEHQIERIRKLPDRKWNWLDEKEYGIKTETENYAIPITKAAFLSLAEGFNFKYTRIVNSEVSYFLDTTAFIYIGKQDSYQTSDSDAVQEFYKEKIKKPFFCIEEMGNHELDKVSEKVIQNIIEWFDSSTYR